MTTPSRGLEVGATFTIVGNTFETGGTSIGFLGVQTGRPPDLVERQKRPTGKPTQRPADFPAQARELHASGLSCPQVAAKLGVPFGTAKLWIWPASQTWEKLKARRARRRERQAAA